MMKSGDSEGMEIQQVIILASGTLSRHLKMCEFEITWVNTHITLTHTVAHVHNYIIYWERNIACKYRL